MSLHGPLDVEVVAFDLDAVSPDAFEGWAFEDVAAVEIELASILRARQDRAFDAAQRERGAVVRAGIGKGKEGAIDVDDADVGPLEVDSLHFAADQIVPGCYYRHS